MATSNETPESRVPGECPCCGREGGFEFDEPADPYGLWRCAGCDVVFSEPMEAGRSEWYDALYIVRQQGVDARLRPHFRWALDRLEPGTTLLDVGCGTGFFVHAARERGLDAWGIDFAPGTVRSGRRYFDTDALLVGSLDELPRPLRGRRFDVVTFFELLEHQSDPGGFIEEVRGVLRPGGRMLLSVPNRTRWPVREFNDYPPHHLLRWSEEGLRKFLTRQGCEILALDKTSRLSSANYFFGYFARLALYGLLGLRMRGGADDEAASQAGRGLLERWRPGRLISAARRLRDALMWAPALVTWPFLRHKIQGYHLVAEARPRK